MTRGCRANARLRLAATTQCDGDLRGRAGAHASDAIYVEETVTHAIPLRKHLPLHRPQSFFRHNGGGLGQGIGIALASSSRRRRSLWFCSPETAACCTTRSFRHSGRAKQYDLPILIVVLNNQSYESMGRGHRLYFPTAWRTAPTSATREDRCAAPFEDLGRPFGFSGARRPASRSSAPHSPARSRRWGRGGRRSSTRWCNAGFCSTASRDGPRSAAASTSAMKPMVGQE